MSEYSDWKNGDITDDQYRAAAGRERSHILRKCKVNNILMVSMDDIINVIKEHQEYTMDGLRKTLDLVGESNVARAYDMCHDHIIGLLEKLNTYD